MVVRLLLTHWLSWGTAGLGAYSGGTILAVYDLQINARSLLLAAPKELPLEADQQSCGGIC
jgi:hypothetical protein